MKTTINSRFAEIIHKLYKGNKRAFAHAIDVSPTVIENVVGTRQGKPSYDVIEKVCANANVLPEWLLTGNGPMLRDELPSAASPPVVVYERDPRDIDMIATQKELIAMLKREKCSDSEGLDSARYVDASCSVSGDSSTSLSRRK